MGKLKRFGGMRQTVVRHQRGNVSQFGLVRPQELAPRRNVEKQVANRYRGAAAAGNFFAGQHLAAGNFNTGPGFFLGRTCFQQQPGDRCNGRQRFSPETQRGDGIQVPDVIQFAGGVPFKGQHGIVAQHATAVIVDADQPAAAAFHFHPDAGGPGIQRVFQQLFDYRRGTLHHFAGGDLVGNVIGKNTDPPHVFNLP